LADLKVKFEHEVDLRRNATKNLQKASKALEAAIKEFDIAKQALLSADEQLSVHRAEKALERINTLENYLAAEAGISLCFHVPPQSLVTLC